MQRGWEEKEEAMGWKLTTQNTIEKQSSFVPLAGLPLYLQHTMKALHNMNLLKEWNGTGICKAATRTPENTL